MSISGSHRSDTLQTFSSRVGYAVRKAFPEFCENDQIRFISPIQDVLEDLGDALRLGHVPLHQVVVSAPSDVRREINLFAALAQRSDDACTMTSCDAKPHGLNESTIDSSQSAHLSLDEEQQLFFLEVTFRICELL